MEVCNGGLGAVVFVFELKDAIDGSDTMKNMQNIERIKVIVYEDFCKLLNE